MSKQINVLVLNTEEELKSFPLNQSIKLKFSEEVEDSQLYDCISLIRNLSETGLFNISERYNQSIGYVREKFDIEDVEISSETTIDGCIVTITPIKPLSPSFDYTLFVDKQLSKEFLTVTKTVSKSKSEIKVSVSDTSINMHNIEIVSDPSITNTSNIIKVAITDTVINKVTEKSVNLKRTKELKVNKSLSITFLSDVYLKGEKFEVRSDYVYGLDSNLLITIRTSTTKDVKPIETEENFKRVTNEDILNYYKTRTTQTSNSNMTLPGGNTTINIGTGYVPPPRDENSVQVEIVSKGTIRLLLPKDVTVDDIDIPNISFTHTHAFNMYTLEDFGLYDPKAKYSMDVQVETDTSLLIEFKGIK